MVSGRGQHPLQQLPVAGLQLSSLRQRSPHRRDARGEGIAHPLQLLESGDARLPVIGANRGLNGKAREGLGAETGELLLDAPYLPAQLSAREALVASHSKHRKRVSFEQIWH